MGGDVQVSVLSAWRAGVKGGWWSLLTSALETLYHPPLGNYALCPAMLTLTR